MIGPVGVYENSTSFPGLFPWSPGNEVDENWALSEKLEHERSVYIKKEWIGSSEKLRSQ